MAGLLVDGAEALGPGFKDAKGLGFGGGLVVADGGFAGADCFREKGFAVCTFSALALKMLVVVAADGRFSDGVVLMVKGFVDGTS